MPEVILTRVEVVGVINEKDGVHKPSPATVQQALSLESNPVVDVVDKLPFTSTATQVDHTMLPMCMASNTTFLTMTEFSKRMEAFENMIINKLGYLSDSVAQASAERDLAGVQQELTATKLKAKTYATEIHHLKVEVKHLRERLDAFPLAREADAPKLIDQLKREKEANAVLAMERGDLLASVESAEKTSKAIIRIHH